MSGRTWTVVKFVEEDTVEAVPTTWLVGNLCYWPPYPREKLVTAIKNFEAPNTHWPSHKMEIFRNGTFDTYLEARRKLNVAEYLSDLNQEDEPQTRKIRHKKPVNVSSSEDEATPSQTEKILPKPPTRPTNVSVEDIPSRINIDAVPSTTSGTCSCCPYHKGISADDEIKRIKKQYVFLTNIMADMKTDLTEIKSTLSTKVLHSAEESFFLKFSFPINDEATLETVESYLIIDENFQNAVPELANIGGHNVYDFVKRAMTFLVTNKFASKYSFLGRKQKGSFSILKLSELLIKAANHSKKADRKEVEEAISKWLRRANERKGQ